MEIKFSKINSGFIKNVLIIIVLIGICYSMRSLVNLILLTFFLTFTFYSIQKFIFKLLHKYIKAVNRKEIAIAVYILICSLIALILYKYIPVTTRQVTIIMHQMSNFDLNNYKGVLNDNVINVIENIDIQSYISQSSKYVFGSLSHVGAWGVDIFLSLILSLMFNLEKEEIQKFMSRLKESKIGFIYDSGAYFGRTFLSSFGKVMQIQIITAAISAVVTFVWLTILGFHQALGFSIMMFTLTLIPVVGVLICMVPLCIVAFRIGGMIKLIDVLIMLLVLHALESYVIKPKLMSMEIKLPIFITFVVLVVSEHFMGIWGLLLGLPLFMFLLDVLGIRQQNKK